MPQTDVSQALGLVLTLDVSFWLGMACLPASQF